MNSKCFQVFSEEQFFVGTFDRRLVKDPHALVLLAFQHLRGYGASNHFHPTLCTTSISYRPIEADGRCLVTLIADHRVIDGAVVARSLANLEKFLQQDLVHELRSQTDSRATDVTPSRRLISANRSPRSRSKPRLVG